MSALFLILCASATGSLEYYYFVLDFLLVSLR